MWLTQTYLESPKTNYPLYAYVFFNPYTDWDGGRINELKRVLANLGRITGKRIAIFAPDEKEDFGSIGRELDLRFQPLVNRLNKIWIYVGIFIADKPLDEVSSDGSNSRFAFFRFDKNLSLLNSGIQIEEFLKFLNEASVSATDPVQELLLSLHRSDAIGRRLLQSVSLSASGPSVRLADIAAFFRGKDYVDSNIYDLL